MTWKRDQHSGIYQSHNSIFHKVETCRATYHCNEIQESGRSTFWERIGHLNGILICYGLVGCHAASEREEIGKGCSMHVLLDIMMYCLLLYAHWCMDLCMCRLSPHACKNVKVELMCVRHNPEKILK